jgi:peptidoglycan hydrolase-like protein with peptidoglycan-binding domain
LLDQIVHLTGRIIAMKKRIDAIAREGETSRRLQTMPGVGPISALAVETFAPPMEQFKRGRDFAAWLGLVPRQASTGGKQKLGKTSKMDGAPGPQSRQALMEFQVEHCLPPTGQLDDQTVTSRKVVWLFPERLRF